MPGCAVLRLTLIRWESSEMKQVYSFDVVHDAQSLFRKLLQSMANPFQKSNIDKEAGGFQSNLGAVLAVGATLMDNEITYYVEKNVELAQQLHAYTLATPADYKKADFIYLTGMLNYENIRQLLSEAKQGTLADPQQSCTFVIWCPQLDGETAAEVSGPGVDGTLEVQTTEYIKTICRLRQEVQQEYPCGVDLIFISAENELMAVPRLCKVK